MNHTQRDMKMAEDIKTVRRVTGVGMAANILLAAVKFVAGVVGHSQVVLADAVHSLSDCATDIAVLIGSEYWSRPPDSDHPYGHRRIETVVAIIVGFILVGAGGNLAWRAMTTLRDKSVFSPGWIGFVVAVISIVGKEALYHWTFRAGRRIRSVALEANAWHHRSDALSSVVTALAVGGAWMFPEWTLLDNIGTVIVAVFILQAAFKIMRPGLRELVDRGAPGEASRTIYRIALETDGVKSAHGLRTRYLGADLQVDLHVLVDGALTVRQGHDISEEVTRRIVSEGPHVIDVVVHTEPA